ncbi:MAG: hypothetical protein ACFFAF_18300 [Candidatus Hermodarchaeota archaeon]
MKIIHLITINTMALIAYLFYFFLPIVLIIGEYSSKYYFSLSIFLILRTYGGFIMLFSIVPVVKLIILEKKLIGYIKGTVKLNTSEIEDDLTFIIISIFILKILLIVILSIGFFSGVIGSYSNVIILFPFYLPFITIGLLCISYLANRSLKEDEPPLMTRELIDKIKEEYRNGVSFQELAEKYRVSMIKIAKIVKEH